MLRTERAAAHLERARALRPWLGRQVARDARSACDLPSKVAVEWVPFKRPLIGDRPGGAAHTAARRRAPQRGAPHHPHVRCTAQKFQWMAKSLRKIEE